MSKGTLKHAPSLISAPAFCGMSGSNKARRIDDFGPSVKTCSGKYNGQSTRKGKPMNRNTAERICSTFQYIPRQMDESIRDVMNKDGGENFEWYRRASGKIMGEVFVEVLQPLYDEHPDLVPDQLRPKELGSGWTRTKIKAVLVAQTMAQKL